MELPHPADLRRGVALLEQQLQRVDKKHAAYCLAKLYAGYNERMTAGEIAAKVDIWVEVCAEIPNDLWAAGVMDLLRTWRRDDHFGRIPEPADLLDIVKGRLEKRQINLQRTKAMLAQANAPVQDQQQDVATKWLGPKAKVKQLRAILEQQRNAPDVPGEDRLFNMANTERSLALYERRPMEPWAEQFFDDRVAPARDSLGRQAKVAVDRSSPTNRRAAELAQAKRTPEHFDIPEVSHG